ncbi:hypothetical protein DFH08DRAFT_950403 [Mycena albidolilacea]|uniref:Uncharacterized protein n=1 Tax=Mycena albidolilacea TaxID=1033008 RepID=A0AAD7AQ83_9AGAR|nr:hypothetical protein DFH08DRAFT_950403 [Mycena albidolilacea]
MSSTTPGVRMLPERRSGYIDGTIPNPRPTPVNGAENLVANIADLVALPPEPTVVYSRTPSSDEWDYHDGITTSILILNVKDPVGIGLKTDGSARVLRDLNTTYYAPGMSVVDHATVMRKLQCTANDVGANITDGVFRMIFIASLGKPWRHVTPVLHTYDTSAEVINFLIEEEQAHNGNNVPVPTTALAVTTSQSPSRDACKALVCTNLTCGAQGKHGHTIDECFWPSGGKAGQWPDWWVGKHHGAPQTTAKMAQTYAFAAWTVPAADVSVYNDTGTQNVCFAGEEVVASPTALMDWSEVMDAITEIDVDVGLHEDPHGVSSSGGSSFTSFEVLGSETSKTSSYDMTDDSNGGSDGPSDNPAPDSRDNSPVSNPGTYTAHTKESAVLVFHTFAAGRTTALLDSGSTDHCFS